MRRNILWIVNTREQLERAFELKCRIAMFHICETATNCRGVCSNFVRCFHMLCCTWISVPVCFLNVRACVLLISLPVARQVMMITGDNPLTACHVAKQLGITSLPVVQLVNTPQGENEFYQSPCLDYIT